MRLEVYKQLWGMDGATAQQLAVARAQGYDGVEGSIPQDCSRVDFLCMLEAYGLKYIPIIYTDGGRFSDEHYASFVRQFNEALEYAPQKVNVHGARDYMPFDEQLRYYDGVCSYCSNVKAEVCHETHRGRPLGTPWNTYSLLSRYPELMLTMDISHWCCVCESLLDAQEAEVECALRRSVHLHGRVGYSEGPQVPAPEAPEYAEEAEAHNRWWGLMITSQLDQGRECFTFTPEYGPPKYMHTLPYTNQPVADLLTLCEREANRFRTLFDQTCRLNRN